MKNIWNPLRQTLINFFSIGRLGMAPLTMSVPVMGALTLGEPLTMLKLLGLVLVGLNAHIFGFALNDIIDLPLDREAKTRKRSPLVTGKLSLRSVWLYTLAQIPISLLTYYLISHGALFGIGVLVLSGILSVSYNFWSKWGRMPRFISELALASSVGLLCVAGTLSKSSSLPWESIIFAFSLTLVLLSLNSIPSALKDLKTDYDFGARSFVIVMGSRMLDADKLLISKQVWIYSLGLQSIIVITILILIVLFQPTYFIIALICVLILYGALHLRMILSSQSFIALRRAKPLLNGHYNYLALSLFVMPWMPLFFQMLYSLLIIGLLLIPLGLSFRMWRKRYHLLR